MPAPNASSDVAGLVPCTVTLSRVYETTVEIMADADETPAQMLVKALAEIGDDAGWAEDETFIHDVRWHS